MSPRIITLLTDFGTEDYFVGAMKGVILTRSPKSVLVDITHAIPPQDIRAAAFTLSAAYPYFPAGSIHLAVVDPGVGSDRRPVLVEAASSPVCRTGQRYFYLRSGAGSDSPNPTPDEYRLLPAESAAQLSKAGIFSPRWRPHWQRAFRPRISVRRFKTPSDLRVMRCESMADGTLAGRIMHIDHFGNCVTNLPWTNCCLCLPRDLSVCRSRNFRSEAGAIL